MLVNVTGVTILEITQQEEIATMFRFSRRANRITKTLAATALILTIIGFSVPQASAQGNIITRDTTINALANGVFCWVGDDGAEACSDYDLHVSPDKFGESIIVCLALHATGEEGCADVTATFSMDTDSLTWANVGATPVDLNVTVCEGKVCDFVYSRTVTLTASWTGTGDLVHVNNKLSAGDPHGPCSDTAHILGWVRDAAATVTLDGTSADVYGNLQVLDSRNKVKTNCG
jgi:hypothetical protein